MGIKQLMQLINDKAPSSVSKIQLSLFSGRIVACDASMAMYQFLIATQFTTKTGLGMLTDSEGNPTSHLLGFFNRTISFLENGVKPIWVFDGKPPVLKSGELAKRKKAKIEAKEAMELAEEEGKLEEVKKFSQRSVNITTQMLEDAKNMLRLMGVPVVEAPGEAEAQCCEMVKSGKASAVVSEDMDTLTFGTPFLLRGLSSKKEPITKVDYQEMITSFEMTSAEFVDLCILLGCDYTETIEGIGPATAFKLIKEHGTIERVIKFIEANPKKKYKVPENFNFEGARELFLHPEVTNTSELNLVWEKPDSEGLQEFLVQKKNFAPNRVETGIKKLQSFQGKPTQMRMENFFGNPIVKRKAPTPKPAKKQKTNPKS